eukprot:gene16669-biopygen12749
MRCRVEVVRRGTANPNHRTRTNTITRQASVRRPGQQQSCAGFQPDYCGASQLAIPSRATNIESARIAANQRRAGLTSFSSMKSRRSNIFLQRAQRLRFVLSDSVPRNRWSRMSTLAFVPPRRSRAASKYWFGSKGGRTRQWLSLASSLGLGCAGAGKRTLAALQSSPAGLFLYQCPKTFLRRR